MKALIPSIAMATGLVVAGCVSLPGLASEASGEIRLLPVCPGDDQPPKITDAQHLDSLFGEPEAADILLTFIGVLIKQGLSIAGQRLNEAAQEQTVDMLHSGDFRLYQTKADIKGTTVALSSAVIVPANRCLLVISKSTTSKKANEEVNEERIDLVKGYKRLKEYHRPHEYGSKLRLTESYTDGASELEKSLRDRPVPGLLAVIDIVPSATMDSFRLEPRFVATDHSIREEKRDNKNRDFTLSIKMTAPGAKSPREMLLKFEKLSREQPFVRSGQVTSASPWQPLLPLTEAESAKYRASVESHARTMSSAIKVYAGIEELVYGKQEEVPKGIDRDKSIGSEHSCKYIRNSNDVNMLFDKSETSLMKLELLQKVHDMNDPKDRVAAEAHVREDQKLRQYKSYWSACRDYYAAWKELKERFVVNADGTDSVNADGTEIGFGVLDVHVEIKEYRKRPVSEFLGALLSDSDLQKAYADAVTTAVAGEKAPGQVELDTAYETALVSASKAIAAYEADPTNANWVAMEAAKRAANRIASEQSRPLPYPDSGLWIFQGM